MTRFVVRILCKCYEYLLRAYTNFVFDSKGDPSRILVESLSPLQQAHQTQIDGRPVVREFSGEILVVVPFKDRWDLTEKCLESLAKQALPSGSLLHVVLADNNSSEESTKMGIASVRNRWPTIRFSFFTASYEFNYSRINNDAVRNFSTPETKWVVFLNNDVELRTAAVLSQMVGVSETYPEVGPVGATLVFPNHEIQHIFAVPGVKIVAAHPLKYVRLNHHSEWLNRPVRVVPAVTGALMLMRLKDFQAVGMFDEELATLAQDIDLCLTCFAKLRLVPAVLTEKVAIHHESKTKKGGFSRTEIERFYQRWSDLDQFPLYSERFSRWSEVPVLKMVRERAYPWRKII